MAGDQNVALMLMQVLIQLISNMENKFMAWFHVFFLDDVIEIGQLMGYFENQAIQGINGYFDSMYSESKFRRHFRMSRETVEVLTRMIRTAGTIFMRTKLGNAPLSEKVVQKKT